MTHRLIALEASLLFRVSPRREPGYEFNGRQYCYIVPGAAELVRAAVDSAGIVVVWSATEDIVTLRTAWYWVCKREQLVVPVVRFYGEEHWGSRHYREGGMKCLYTLCGFLMHATSLSRAIAVDRALSTVTAPADHLLLCVPEQQVGGPDCIRAFNWDSIRDADPVKPKRRRIRRKRKTDGEAVVRVRRASKSFLEERKTTDALSGLRARDRAWLRRSAALRKRLNVVEK